MANRNGWQDLEVTTDFDREKNDRCLGLRLGFIPKKKEAKKALRIGNLASTRDFLKPSFPLASAAVVLNQLDEASEGNAPIFSECINALNPFHWCGDYRKHKILQDKPNLSPILVQRQVSSDFGSEKDGNEEVDERVLRKHPCPDTQQKEYSVDAAKAQDAPTLVSLRDVPLVFSDEVPELEIDDECLQLRYREIGSKSLIC